MEKNDLDEHYSIKFFVKLIVRECILLVRWIERIFSKDTNTHRHSTGQPERLVETIPELQVNEQAGLDVIYSGVPWFESKSRRRFRE
jgi:hypothetical protein